jgi:UDP-N-acetylmuramate--alanine ligase
MPEGGVVVLNPDDPNVLPILEGSRGRVVDYTKESVPPLKLLGAFNQLNAKAAKAAAKSYNLQLEEKNIDASVASFEGAWRRFEKKGELPSGALVYDDYAHHPTAIRETLKAAREKFPGKRITIAFHPHLYSRTKDLFEGFVTELAKADKVILAPIYPAREKPIPGITSEFLAESIRQKNRQVQALATFEEIEEEVCKSATQDDLIITMGAGDIYKVADRITHTS